MSDYLLEIDKLNVEYITDDAIVYALNDFSLSVERGEKIGLASFYNRNYVAPEIFCPGPLR